MLQHTFHMVQTTQDEAPLKGIQNYLQTVKLFYTHLFGWFFKRLIHYWYLLFLGLLLGIGYGYLKFKQTPAYFEGQAAFTYNELHKKTYGEMTDKLRTLVHSKSYRSLSKLLAISETDAQNIYDIEAITISGSQLSQDLTTSKMPFYVHVKLTNRQSDEALLNSIETYFNNNYQARTIIERTTAQMRARIVHLNSELQKLDSLKRAYQFYLLEKNNNVNPTVNAFNPIDLYTASEKLFNTKSDLEAAVNDFKAVKILDRFAMTDDPIKPSFSKFLMKFGSIGLLIAAMICFVLVVFKKD